MSNTQYSGNPYQTPVKFRTNAPRQTEEQARPTRTDKRPLPRVIDDEMGDDGWTVEKPHTSAVRYDQSYPSLSPRNRTKDVGNPRRTRLVKQRRPLVGRLLLMLGFSLFALILAVLALQALGNWWQRHTDDVTYGYPRTYQTDQYVGHGDSQAHPNHFIALNLNGVVVVLEVNPQHPQLDKSYYVTTTSDPLNPVTVTFPTIDGKQYMYVSVGDLSNNPYTVSFVNDGKEFTSVQH